MQAGKGFIAGNKLCLPAFDVIVTGIQHLARFGELIHVAGHGVLNQVGRGASALAGNLLQFGLHGRFKLHFRGGSSQW